MRLNDFPAGQRITANSSEIRLGPLLPLTLLRLARLEDGPAQHGDEKCGDDDVRQLCSLALDLCRFPLHRHSTQPAMNAPWSTPRLEHERFSSRRRRWVGRTANCVKIRAVQIERMRRGVDRRRRFRRSVAVLVSCAVFFVESPVARASTPSVVPSDLTFPAPQSGLGGYNWLGKVKEIGARWKVPVIYKNSARRSSSQLDRCPGRQRQRLHSTWHPGGTRTHRRDRLSGILE